MTNKLVVIINSLKYQKLRKLYYMKWNFFVKLQLPPEPLTKGLQPPDPRHLCPQLNLLNPPGKKFLGTPLSHTTIFEREKNLLNVMCILIYLQCLSGIFLILRRLQQDIVINVHRSSCNGPIILVRFSSNLNFLNRFLKTTQIPNFILKNLLSVSWVVLFRWMDRQTWQT